MALGVTACGHNCDDVDVIFRIWSAIVVTDIIYDLSSPSRKAENMGLGDQHCQKYVEQTLSNWSVMRYILFTMFHLLEA